MNHELSIIRLVAEASLPVQFVIGLLVLASVVSWALIFRKRLVIGRARREADEFESSFWTGGDLTQLYRTVESRGGATGTDGAPPRRRRPPPIRPRSVPGANSPRRRS